FRRQRRLLTEGGIALGGLAGIIAKSARTASKATRIAGAAPLSFQVGIEAVAECRPGIGYQQQRRNPHRSPPPITKSHAGLRVICARRTRQTRALLEMPCSPLTYVNTLRTECVCYFCAAT